MQFLYNIARTSTYYLMGLAYGLAVVWIGILEKAEARLRRDLNLGPLWFSYNEERTELHSQSWLRFEARTSFVRVWRIDLPRTKIKSTSINHTNIKSILMITLKPSDVRLASKTRSISITHTIPESFYHHTKNKSISTRTPSIWSLASKTSQFRSQHWNEVKFDPPHDNHLFFYDTTYIKSIRPPLLYLINFDAPTQKLSSFRSRHKNQVCVDFHKKTSQFRSRHWNQIKLIPHTKIRSISTTHSKT